MTAKLFEAALGIAPQWTVASVEFDEKAKTLTVLIDFKPGSRFEVSGTRVRIQCMTPWPRAIGT